MFRKQTYFYSSYHISKSGVCPSRSPIQTSIYIMNVFLYDPSQRFFKQRGHRLFLKSFLYKRWLLNATSRREVSHCRPIMSEVCTVCACAVFYSPYCCPDLTGSLQWIQIVIFISILERICTKEKKRYSPPQPCSLWFLHQGRTSCFCFILHRQMWHVGCWHFGYNSMDVWVCAFVCVWVCVSE